MPCRVGDPDRASDAAYFHVMRVRSKHWDEHYSPDFFFQRAAAPAAAISFRRSGDIFDRPFGTFFVPPLRPRATAAGFFRLAILTEA